MSKDSTYFSHDYNTRSDLKIKNLIRFHGMLGYGIWWAIVEDLYNNSNILNRDYELIAYDLRVNSEIIQKIIENFDLFILSENSFSSSSVGRRLDFRNNKSESSRKSVSSRWDKNNNQTISQHENDTNVLRSNQFNDTNVLRSNCERIDIDDNKNTFVSKNDTPARAKRNKGNKGKEIKEIKEIKENKEIKEIKEKLLPEWAMGFLNFNPEIIYPFEFKSFCESWDLWVQFRVEKRWGKYKKIGEQAALKNLAEISGGSLDDCLKIINQSIANGWMSLQPIKKINNQQNSLNGNQGTDNLRSDIARHAASLGRKNQNGNNNPSSN